MNGIGEDRDASPARGNEPFWLDVVAFEGTASLAERTADDHGAALREAVDLYTGDLLEGCYDEWLDGERQRLRGRFLDALRRLTLAAQTTDDVRLLTAREPRGFRVRP